jgi:predicted transcriptional regulator
MRKTSVYLDDDEAERLKRVAASTGRPQAELIREGVRRVIATAQHDARKFRSLGKGRGGAAGGTTWSAAELYKRKVAGKR